LQRCGILYGDYDAVSGTITAHCIYEPEQEGDDMFFKLLPDPREKRVDAIAKALGLRRVGIILTHPPRDAEEIVLTAGELLLLAREQSRFGDECVLLTVAPDPATHQIAAQAWQASEQCVRLFRMGVLSRDEHPGMVRSTIPLELAQDVRDEKGHQKCVVRQPSDTIDARWMTAYCAVESFDSNVIQNKFVRISRPGEAPPDFPNLRAYLSDPKRNRLPFCQQISDFHVLIFLAEKLLQREADIVALVAAVKNGDASGAARFEEMVRARVKA
jgi:nuclear protein localization family protein 4